MNKRSEEWRVLFYRTMGETLKARMEKKGLTINRLASKAGEQYNTVKGVLEGRPFQFHQAVWIKDYLGMSIDDLIHETTMKIFKDEFHGKKESSGASLFV